MAALLAPPHGVTVHVATPGAAVPVHGAGHLDEGILFILKLRSETRGARAAHNTMRAGFQRHITSFHATLSPCAWSSQGTTAAVVQCRTLRHRGGQQLCFLIRDPEQPVCAHP